MVASPQLLVGWNLTFLTEPKHRWIITRVRCNALPTALFDGRSQNIPTHDRHLNMPETSVVSLLSAPNTPALESDSKPTNLYNLKLVQMLDCGHHEDIDSIAIFILQVLKMRDSSP
uniref:Uncharacterized protein n=1 Tax=Sphaerodactylus townsendi TaxID=933632 RepID=A0ACB8ECF2_9SAUR